MIPNPGWHGMTFEAWGENSLSIILLHPENFYLRIDGDKSTVQDKIQSIVQSKAIHFNKAKPQTIHQRQKLYR